MDFLEEEFDEVLNIFRDESEEHIQKLNKNLLKIEEDPTNLHIITELFREAHSLKGSARMIGLTAIESLSHKLEDIIGLAREGGLIIDSEIIDVLCKTVDCIASIVEESIKTKGDYSSAYVDQVVKELHDIEAIKKQSFELDDGSNAYEDTDLKKHDEQVVKFCNANSKILIEIKNYSEELRNDLLNIDLITNFHNDVGDLFINVQSLDDNNIKDLIQDLLVKLDSVVKGSGFLLEPEADDIDEMVGSIIEFFKNVLNVDDIDALQVEEANLPVVDVLNKDREDPYKNITAQTEQIKDEIITDFIDIEPIAVSKDVNNNNLKEFLEKLKENCNIFLGGNLTASDDILTILTSLLVYCDQDRETKLLNKFFDIFNFLKETSIIPDVEIGDILKQCIESLDLLLLSQDDSLIEDPELIIQRLDIVYQMLKMSVSEQSGNYNLDNQDNTQEKTESNTFLSPVPPDDKMPQIFVDEQQDSSEKKSFSNSSQGNTIRTLRVDTKKLDQLVNLVGELIITKIKAKEHLSEIEKIMTGAEDCYRELTKAKQIVKFLDKRPVRPQDLPSGTSIYSQNKSISTIFDDSSLQLVEFMDQMSSLYKTIQEDDARLSLIVNELEEKIKSIRVLPLATIFHIFPRMIRDISREHEKEIDFEIVGSQTSVDKKIIEDIKSPLMHIIRNSIDHGIETPQERLNKGKPAAGKITLAAYHLENSVLIEISDDGKGINLDAIKEKAVEKGFLTTNELKTMSNEQIMNIIFWPGFSTGDVITDLSGRGVGLDVVYSKIVQLDGKVNIKSEYGKGCKVAIQLPVTMATINSFLVNVNNQTFAIPTSSIKTALLVKRTEIFHKEGKETILVDSKPVPVFYLSEILEMSHSQVESEKIVVIVIESDDRPVGFIIDKLIGDQEILHKKLTAPLVRVRNVAGVTTLGSGELCLILNVNDLIKSAYVSMGINTNKSSVVKEKNTTVKRKKILVVDDSVTTRILERNILRAAGYDVTVAINGLDALTKVSSDKFDLIVSDVEMPEINGYELTERLRKDESLKSVPIILVTSLASEIDRMKGLKLGANAYITKGNFDQEELLSSIKTFI